MFWRQERQETVTMAFFVSSSGTKENPNFNQYVNQKIEGAASQLFWSEESLDDWKIMELSLQS